MIRVWPSLVLVALLGGQQTAAFAQLTVKEKSSAPLKPSEAAKKTWGVFSYHPEGPTKFTHDGQTLASYHPKEIGLVILWDARSGTLKDVLPAHKLRGATIAVTCMAFNSDGTVMATGGGNDKTVKLWDLKTGKQLAVFRQSAAPQSVAFKPDDDKTLAIVCEDSTEVVLWDVATGRERAHLLSDLGNHSTRTVLFSPNGKLLIAHSRDDVIVWDMKTERPNREEIYGYNGYSSVVSADSKTLATSFPSEYATHPFPRIRLWDLETGKPKHTLEVATNAGDHGSILGFSPDGRTLAGRVVKKQGTAVGIELIAVDSGKLLARLEGAQPPVYFSADGKTITTLSLPDKDGVTNIKVWELTWEKPPAK